MQEFLAEYRKRLIMVKLKADLTDPHIS